jgi:hypothetical protein
MIEDNVKIVMFNCPFGEVLPDLFLLDLVISYNCKLHYSRDQRHFSIEYHVEHCIDSGPWLACMA